SVLHYRSGADRVEAPISGLTMPSHTPASFLSSVKTFKNRYFRKVTAPGASTARADAPRTAGVHISGTYDVTGMPRSPTEFEIVVACQGATSFGFFCGSQT